MAAWQPLGVDGRTWEAFSFVCSESAHSAPKLFDQLAYRGYSQEDYAAALADWEKEAGLNGSKGKKKERGSPTSPQPRVEQCKKKSKP